MESSPTWASIVAKIQAGLVHTGCSLQLNKVDRRRMCPNCRAFITTADKVCPYCDAPVAARAVDQRSPADLLGGLIPHARFTTVVILLINTGLFLATLIFSIKMGSGGMDIDGRVLFAFGAKYREAILAGQWWRLITAGFLHGGMWHILMNSYALFIVGSQVEQEYGTNRYLVIYLVANVTGFLASFYWTSALSVGASAGIFGLIGAMIALGMREKSRYGSALQSQYLMWAALNFVIGIFGGFAIDNAAHLGGIAGGFAVAYVAGTPRIARSSELIWKVAAIIAVGVTVVAFVEMFVWLMAAIGELR
jgi:rhomboid protease GluP